MSTFFGYGLKYTLFAHVVDNWQARGTLDQRFTSVPFGGTEVFLQRNS